MSDTISINKLDVQPHSARKWRIPDALLRLVSPLVLLLLWELASQLGWIPARVIAAPSQIGGTLWAMIVSGELGKHLWCRCNVRCSAWVSG